MAWTRAERAFYTGPIILSAITHLDNSDNRLDEVSFFWPYHSPCTPERIEARHHRGSINLNFPFKVLALVVPAATNR